MMWNFATPEETEERLQRRRLRSGPLLARGQARPARGPVRLHDHRDDGSAPGAPPGGASPPLRGGGTRGRGRSAGPQLRAAQHRRPSTRGCCERSEEQPVRSCLSASSSCRATASAPRSRRRPGELLEALGDFEITELLIGGASIDEHGTALTDEVLEACRAVRRGAALRGRRAEVGHDRPGQAAPRAGAARPAQGARPVRQPAAGQAERGAARREPAEARADRGHRPAGRPRAHRRHLLRRLRPRRRSRPRRLRLHGRGDRADRPRRLRGGRGAPGQADLGRQGQRARDLSALARDGHPARAGVRGDRAGPPARRQRRDAARLAARQTST